MKLRKTPNPVHHRLLLVAALPLYFADPKEREAVYSSHKYGAATAWLQRAIDGEIEPQATKAQEKLSARLVDDSASIFHMAEEGYIGLRVAKNQDGLWAVASRKVCTTGRGVVAVYPHKNRVPDLLAEQTPIYLSVGEASASGVANLIAREGSELYRQALLCVQVADLHGSLRAGKYLVLCLKDGGKIMYMYGQGRLAFYKALPYAKPGDKPRCQFFLDVPPDLGCHPTGALAILPQSRSHEGDVLDVIPIAERAIRGLLASRVVAMVGVVLEGEFYICGLHFDGETTTSVVYHKGRRLLQFPTLDLDKKRPNDALLLALKEVLDDPTTIEECPTIVHRFYGIASSFALGLGISGPQNIADLFEVRGYPLMNGENVKWLIERRPDDPNHPMAKKLDTLLGKHWIV